MSQQDYGFGEPKPQPMRKKNTNTARPTDWPAPDDGSSDPNIIPSPLWNAPQTPYQQNPNVYPPPQQPPTYNNYPYGQPQQPPYHYQQPQRPMTPYQQRYYPMQQPPPAYNPQAEAYRQALKRVNARVAFFKHLTIYLMINGFLWMLALMSMSYGPWTSRLWPVWITVFWGIGLVSQWWNVFGISESRKQELIEEEMRRIKYQ